MDMNIYLEQFVNKKFTRPGKALDLGAGKFFDVAGLNQMGWKCYGVDKLTGVNLEKSYKAPQRPFDLVFSNYVLHKLNNPEKLIITAYSNLKSGGWLFIHTFDKSDKISKSKFNAKVLSDLLVKTGFRKVACETFKFYDNDPGHQHWHKILQAVAHKPNLPRA